MEENGETISIARPDGVGAVTISMYVEAEQGETSAYDLAHRFSEQLGEAKPALISQSRAAATVDVRKHHRYWRIAAFRRVGQAILITYTCDADDEQQDYQTVEAILSSFEWDVLPN